jgi:hypothetical protein
MISAAAIEVCPACGSEDPADRRRVNHVPFTSSAWCSFGWHDGTEPGYQRPRELVLRDRSLRGAR